MFSYNKGIKESQTFEHGESYETVRSHRDKMSSQRKDKSIVRQKSKLVKAQGEKRGIKQV